MIYFVRPVFYLSNLSGKEELIKLYNAYGQVVYTTKSIGKVFVKIDVSGIEAGLYNLIISNSEGKMRQENLIINN